MVEHVLRTTPDQISRRILDERVYCSRRDRRPRLQWIDGVVVDARSTTREDFQAKLLESLTPQEL